MKVRSYLVAFCLAALPGLCPAADIEPTAHQDLQKVALKLGVVLEDLTVTEPGPGLPVSEPADSLTAFPLQAQRVADAYNIGGYWVPGTELCVQGDTLRTKEPVRITEPVTEGGDCHEMVDNVEVCFSEPVERERLIFVGHLSSPIERTYSFCKVPLVDAACFEMGTRTAREILTFDVKWVTYGADEAKTVWRTESRRIASCPKSVEAK